MMRFKINKFQTNEQNVMNWLVQFICCFHSAIWRKKRFGKRRIVCSDVCHQVTQSCLSSGTVGDALTAELPASALPAAPPTQPVVQLFSGFVDFISFFMPKSKRFLILASKTSKRKSEDKMTEKTDLVEL